MDIIEIKSIVSIAIKIYDRWSILIYKTNNYSDEWGIGEKLKPGVYFYYLYAKGSETKN